MPLALVSRSPVHTESAVPPIQETDLDRILKLVPTEVLAFYTAAVSIGLEILWRYFPLVLFFAGTAMVPLVLYLDGHSTNQSARWPQYAVRILAFVAWANAISWPFFPWVDEHQYDWARSLAVLIVPLVGGLVLREKLPTPRS